MHNKLKLHNVHEIDENTLDHPDHFQLLLSIAHSKYLEIMHAHHVDFKLDLDLSHTSGLWFRQHFTFTLKY